VNKNLLFLIGNIVLAVLLFGVGVTAGVLALLVLYITGIMFIISGIISISDYGFATGGIIILLGVACFVIPSFLGNGTTAMILSYIAIALIGIWRLRGLSKYHGQLTRKLAVAYSVLIIVGSVIGIITSLMNKGEIIEIICLAAGSVLWIVCAVREYIYAKNHNSGSKSSYQGSTSQSYSGGNSSAPSPSVRAATPDEVRRKMQDIAYSESGAYANLSFGVSARYSVSVSVFGSGIEFKIDTQLSGVNNLREEHQIDSVKNDLSYSLQNKANAIFGRADRELSNMILPMSYEVNVKSGTVNC
jgi:hypothetical protein